MSSTSGIGGPQITTDEEVVNYLTAKYPGSVFSSATRLTGGTANAVWRINVETLANPSPVDAFPGDGLLPLAKESVIFKHAEPYVISNPAIPFAVERMDTEAQVMRLVPALFVSQPQDTELKIIVPKVFAYDQTAHVLAIGDGGNSTLKDAYALLSTTQVQSIGHRLGRWLAQLHTQTTSVQVENRHARFIYRYAYSNVGPVWQKLGIGKEGLGKEVDESIGALLLTDSECVCHGDFWPGNMLLNDAVSDQGKTDIPVSIVDWEMTRRGVGATDAAQFTAEAYLLDRFRGAHHRLAWTFLTTYIEQAKPDDAFWKRFAVHMGVHLSFWPSRVEWAGEAETRRLAEIGASIVTMALEGDEQLKDYILNQLTDASASRS